MCTDCQARARMMRQDLINARMIGAATHAVKGLAEMVGLKEKTGAAEEAEFKVEAETPAKAGAPIKQAKGKPADG